MTPITVEVEEARSAFLFYDFLNFDLLNQQSFMLLDLSAWRCRFDRFACVIGAGERAGDTTSSPLPAAANEPVPLGDAQPHSLASWAVRLITHLC
jgi:hypothetical protein